MIKLIFPLGLSFCLVFVFQNSSSIQLNTTEQLTQDTCIGKYLGGQKHGQWICWFDGKYYEYIYHKDLLQGVAKTYYDTTKKQLFLLESYVDGLRHGSVTSFYPNGNPHFITNYREGRYYRDIEYDSLGNLFRTGNYILDSINTGITIFDPETLEVREEKDNVTLKELKHGTWFYYDPDGILIKEYHFSKGVLLDSVIRK